METVKYICEFFFGSFWHFLGLIIVLDIIFPLVNIRNKRTKNKEDLQITKPDRE